MASACISGPRVRGCSNSLGVAAVTASIQSQVPDSCCLLCCTKSDTVMITAYRETMSGRQRQQYPGDTKKSVGAILPSFREACDVNCFDATCNIQNQRARV